MLQDDAERTSGAAARLDRPDDRVGELPVQPDGVRVQESNRVRGRTRTGDRPRAKRREDRVRLERRIRRRVAVIDQRVQQRMPQPRQRRASIAPLELIVLPPGTVEMDQHRTRGGEIEPAAAIADEPIG